MPQTVRLQKLQATLDKLTGSGEPPADRPQPLTRDVPGVAAEPIYSQKIREDIQGNILPGFGSPHQTFLFLRFGTPAKAFLRFLLPMVSSMQEVMAFRKLNSARRDRLGTPETRMSAVWVNVAFSHAAIAKLSSVADANAFGDEPFRQGLAERSSFLGDPTAASNKGSAGNWKVGGPANEAAWSLIASTAFTSCCCEYAGTASKGSRCD